MPRGNGTGPVGMGPMTGRGAGFCAGFGMPGYANRGGGGFFGRGMGFRFFAGGGPGWMRAGYPPYYSVGLSAEEEHEALSRQTSAMEAGLSDLKKRLAELETKKSGNGNE